MNRNQKKSPIFIGVAWPYANGSLHLGHVAGLIGADYLARYFRLAGHPVLMVSGSDCHGTPIEVKAEQEKTTPEKIVEQYDKEFNETLVKGLAFSYDLFTKTANPFHYQKSQELFLDLLKKKYIYEKMAKQQCIEGGLKQCQKSNCIHTCCDDDQVQEWANEYFAFHERMKDYLKSIGIKQIFKGDRIWFKNCSDGKNCKFLKYSLNKDVDPRPIDCKIYPYEVDWDYIDFDNKIVNLYYWDNDCPLVRNNSIPKDFKKEVEAIVKRDFAVLFYGAKFTVKFINKVHR